MGKCFQISKTLKLWKASQLSFPSEIESCNYKPKLKGDSFKIVGLEGLAYGGVIAKEGAV